MVNPTQYIEFPSNFLGAVPFATAGNWTMELKPGPDGPVLSLWPPAAFRNGPPVHYHLELGNGLTLVQCIMTQMLCEVQFFFTLSIINLYSLHWSQEHKRTLKLLMPLYSLISYIFLLHISTILLLLTIAACGAKAAWSQASRPCFLWICRSWTGTGLCRFACSCCTAKDAKARGTWHV